VKLLKNIGSSELVVVNHGSIQPGEAKEFPDEVAGHLLHHHGIVAVRKPKDMKDAE